MREMRLLAVALTVWLLAGELSKFLNTLLLYERDLIARRNHFTIQSGGEAMMMMQPGGGDPPGLGGGKDVPGRDFDPTGPGAPIQSFRNLNFEGY